MRPSNLLYFKSGCMNWADFLHDDSDTIITLYLWLFKMPIYCRCTCQTPGISWKDPVKQGLFVYPSYHLSGCFLGIGSLDFSEFWRGSRNPYEVLHDRAGVFWGKIFLVQKLGKWAKNKVLWKLKRNVIKFPWICSIMKIYIIWCVPAQVLCWEKSYFWDVGQIAPTQWDCKIFSQVFLRKKLMKQPHFFAFCYKFTKIKSWLKISWLGIVKNGSG